MTGSLSARLPWTSGVFTNLALAGAMILWILSFEYWRQGMMEMLLGAGALGVVLVLRTASMPDHRYPLVRTTDEDNLYTIALVLRLGWYFPAFGLGIALFEGHYPFALGAFVILAAFARIAMEIPMEILRENLDIE